MPIAASPRRAGRVLLALLLAAAALLALLPAGADARTVSTTPTRIDREAGVRLEAWVSRPARPARAQLPLVVLIGSWNGQSYLDLLAARRLAARGYVVVTYATRGAPGSGGFNSMAGPEDLADASAVIDWALARTGADPERIGVGGASYGAGLALLTAAHDPRVRAVVSLSGWGDLAESLYPGQTRNAAIALIMRNTGNDEGRTDARFNDRWRLFQRGWDIPGFLTLMRERSPVTYVDRLNTRRTAVFLAHTWNETAFPPDQLITFYEQLTGPRRLELRPGEHISAETPARFGLDNDVWSGVMRWFDTTLASGDTSRGGAGIWLRPRSSSGSRPAETYTTWSDVGPRERTFALGAGPRGGTLTDAPAAGDWRLRVDPGTDVALQAGIPIVSHFAESYRLSPPFTFLRAISRRHNGLFLGEPLPAPLRLRGRPRLRMTLTPSARKATIVVHLLAVARDGRAYQILHEPHTIRNAVPGEPVEIDMPLRSTAYDVHAGHRLLLAVSTFDFLYYLDTNPRGAPIVLSGGPGRPASATLPLR